MGEHRIWLVVDQIPGNFQMEEGRLHGMSWEVALVVVGLMAGDQQTEVVQWDKLQIYTYLI